MAQRLRRSDRPPHRRDGCPDAQALPPWSGIEGQQGFTSHYPSARGLGIGQEPRDQRGDAGRNPRRSSRPASRPWWICPDRMPGTSRRPSISAPSDSVSAKDSDSRLVGIPRRGMVHDLQFRQARMRAQFGGQPVQLTGCEMPPTRVGMLVSIKITCTPSITAAWSTGRSSPSVRSCITQWNPPCRSWLPSVYSTGMDRPASAIRDLSGS